MPTATPTADEGLNLSRLDPMSAGAGEDAAMVTVKGKRKCSRCGASVSIDYTGPEGSVGVRVSRRWLERDFPRLCVPCIEKDDAADLERDLAERQAEARRLRIERSGVPERWKAVTFDRLERDRQRTPALDAALEWAEADNPKGLLLHGPVGRGKTVIAAAAANARLQRRAVRWLSVAELLTDLRLPFDSPEYKRALRSISAEHARGALILDDLDKAPARDAQMQPLYVAINGWLERPLPLLVTCNRSPDEIADWAGETFGLALASRLVGYCKVVEVKGRDRRLS